MNRTACFGDKLSISCRHNTRAYKPEHEIYVYGFKNKALKMLKINTGSHEDKNVDKIDNVILTCFSIKFADVPRFILYVNKCIETSSNEVSIAK